MAFSTRLWSGSVILALAAAVSAAPPEKGKKADARKKANEFVDVTQQVDVQFVEGLRSPEALTHEVFVVLRNVSGRPLPGPLALVFDDEKATDFAFDWYTNKLATGKEYYGLVDVDDEIPAGQSSRRRKLYLNTSKPVNEEERVAFASPFRVIRLSDEHVDSKRPVDEEVAGKKYTREEFDRVKEIQERAADSLLTKEVGGVFLGEDANGNLIIKASAERRGAARVLPGSFEGVPIETTVSGKFVRDGKLPKPAGSPAPGSTGGTGSAPQRQATLAQLRTVQTRPVCVGASGMNSVDVCAVATIGCRLKDRVPSPNTGYFALSNNHVFARLNGVNIDGSIFANSVRVGEEVQQPAQGEFINCLKTGLQIGTLSDWELYRYAGGEGSDFRLSAPPNIIDAAIAAVTPNTMDFNPPTDTYGAISRNPITASIGLKIQKVGRTTFWTHGTVVGINGIIFIPDGAQSSLHTRCIITERATSGIFSAGGDSGSLVVTEVANRPVGLVFAGAGDNSTSVICPMGPILDRFNLMVDDGQDGFIGGRSGRIGAAIGPVNRGIRR